VVHKTKEILNKRLPADNFGISVIGEKNNNPNIYLGAITKARCTKKKSLFYVSTDNQQFIEYLVDKTRVEKDGQVFCPIIPNYVGEGFSEEEKFIIDLFCIKEMEHIYSNPFNDYAFNIASSARKGVGIPHEEAIFVSNKLELLNM